MRLPPETHRAVMDQELPRGPRRHDAGCPPVSVVLVTYNNLVFTRLCLAALLRHTVHPNYEIVIVDNGSTDGTPGFLRALEREQPHVRVLFNRTNRGFAAANNQGLSRARGAVLTLLNNDTIVTPGWLTRLAGYLDDSSVGAVGPVTSRCGNEVEVEALYDTYGELVAFARERTAQRRGHGFEIPMLSMFCMALRRETYREVGPIDERFGIGMFEDDDYALRLRAKDYRLICREDVYVHHFGGASFGTLACQGTYGPLFHANRRRFEEKWARPWQPHKRRRSRTYREVVDRIRSVVRLTLPADTTVAVISKGDEALLHLDGRVAWHFPCTDEGTYAGYHPADSAEAIARLEALRARGAAYLLVPQPALWWLDYYQGLRDHLVARYQVCVEEEDTCMIVALDTKDTEGGG